MTGALNARVKSLAALCTWFELRERWKPGASKFSCSVVSDSL